jgi:putative ABC transport system permease protein
MLRQWFVRLTMRRPSDAEIARELHDHLDLDAEALSQSRRVMAANAHDAARRRFGNVGGIGESVHDVWRWIWLEQLAQDARHGVRALARSPAYTIAVTVTLALGIGAGASTFSLSEAIHRPFPQLPGDRLLSIVQRSANCPECNSSSPAALFALRTRAHSMAAVATASSRMTLRTASASEIVAGVQLSANALAVVGAPFALGHGFAAAADRPNAAPTTILAYKFWQEHFASSRGVLDSIIVLGGVAHTVIGVLGRDVVFPEAADVYTPLVLAPESASNYGARYLELFARLTPGASVASAAAEARTIGAQLARESPKTDSGWVLTARPIARYHTDDVVLLEKISSLAALLVFLAACMSAANLALSRTAARRNELALRAALGVRRWRLARHLLTEALLVSLVASALGLVLARWGVRALRNAIPASFAVYLPGWARLGLDARTFAFTLVTAVLAMLAFAALPVLRATRVNLATVLSDGGRASTGGVRGTRTRATLVVLEVSIAIVLLTAATLLMQSVRNMMAGDPGVRLDHALVMNLSLPRGTSDSAVWDFFRRLDENVRTTPGVRAAGLASTTPLSNNYQGTAFEIPGRASGSGNQQLTAIDQRVTLDYGRAAGLRLAAGRAFAPTDADGAQRVAIVNQMLADAMWPGASAIGRIMTIDSVPWTVIGVAANVRHGGFDEPMRYTIYRSLYQAAERVGDLIVWTTGDPLAMRDVVRQVVARTDASAAVGGMMTMTQMEARHVSPYRMIAGMLAVLAVVTMVIATVGLYGLIAYGVAQRTREIGVRIALGATPRVILSQIGIGAVRLAALGVVFGVAGAAGFARLLSVMLYGVTASDPRTFVGVSVGLLLVALTAAIVPSWRASRVDPTVALRE